MHRPWGQTDTDQNPYFLPAFEFRVVFPSWTTKGPKTSTPEFWKGSALSIRSTGRSPLFCVRKPPLNLWHNTQLFKSRDIKERPLWMKKPLRLRTASVIWRPWCFAKQWQYFQIRIVSTCEEGSRIGCFSLYGMGTLLNLPPTPTLQGVVRI